MKEIKSINSVLISSGIKIIGILSVKLNVNKILAAGNNWRHSIGKINKQINSYALANVISR